MQQELDRSVLFDERRDPRWFSHGPLEIKFAPKCVGRSGALNFCAKLSGSEFTSNLTVAELSIILSLETNISRNFAELSGEYKKWTSNIREDFKINRKYSPLNQRLFDVHIVRIKSKLGSDFILKENGPSWRLRDTDTDNLSLPYDYQI